MVSESVSNGVRVLINETCQALDLISTKRLCLNMEAKMSHLIKWDYESNNCIESNILFIEAIFQDRDLTRERKKFFRESEE